VWTHADFGVVITHSERDHGNVGQLRVGIENPRKGVSKDRTIVETRAHNTLSVYLNTMVE
jgi:hypothetical protein